MPRINQHHQLSGGGQFAPRDCRYERPKSNAEQLSLQRALTATRDEYFEHTGLAAPETENEASYLTQYQQLQNDFEHVWRAIFFNNVKAGVKPPTLFCLKPWWDSILLWPGSGGEQAFKSTARDPKEVPHLQQITGSRDDRTKAADDVSQNIVHERQDQGEQAAKTLKLNGDHNTAAGFSGRHAVVNAAPTGNLPYGVPQVMRMAEMRDGIKLEDSEISMGLGLGGWVKPQPDLSTVHPTLPFTSTEENLPASSVKGRVPLNMAGRPQSYEKYMDKLCAESATPGVAFKNAVPFQVGKQTATIAAMASGEQKPQKNPALQILQSHIMADGIHWTTKKPAEDARLMTPTTEIEQISLDRGLHCTREMFFHYLGKFPEATDTSKAYVEQYRQILKEFKDTWVKVYGDGTKVPALIHLDQWSGRIIDWKAPPEGKWALGPALGAMKTHPRVCSYTHEVMFPNENDFSLFDDIPPVEEDNGKIIVGF